MPLFHRPTASMRMSEGVDRMIPMTILTRCCIRGCTRGEAGEIGPRACEGICAEHWLLASAASRRLLRGAEARLERLQRSWDDDEVFEAIVARGRYFDLAPSGRLCVRDPRCRMQDERVAAWIRR